MGAAVFLELGGRVLAADDDLGEALVVAQQDVKARPKLFDQIDFQQQGVGLGAGRGELHRPGQIDHQGDALGVETALGVLDDALLQAPGLADVERLALVAEHAVDAGRIGQPTHLVLDQRRAGKSLAHGGQYRRGVRSRLPKLRHPGRWP
jgi:hypothetical protein